ncbi:MAG: hypothetical protein COB51_05360 [Moraxellaceae bacterium]|nr:MAG: hypothetical protein COB51_05360 [Moraxellaceae bacterium]
MKHRFSLERYFDRIQNSEDVSELFEHLNASDLTYNEFQLEKACIDAADRWALLDEISGDRQERRE